MNRKEYIDSGIFKRSVNTSSTDSILGGLYRNILSTLGLENMMKFNTLMENFLRDPRNGIPANIKDRSSARGNLKKELLRNHMTWKVFCKGLRFLNVPRFEISICLHHRNGDKTFHKTTVVIDDLFIPSKDDDEEQQ